MSNSGLLFVDYDLEHLTQLRAGVEPRLVKTQGNISLVHFACRNEWIDFMKYLIHEHDCDPNAQTADGLTPLHYACRQESRKLVMELLESQCDPNIKATDGKTALDLTSNQTIIRELIRHGASPPDVYLTHGQVLGKYSSQQPLQTPVKIFMVGNPSAGEYPHKSPSKREDAFC